MKLISVTRKTNSKRRKQTLYKGICVFIAFEYSYLYLRNPWTPFLQWIYSISYLVVSQGQFATLMTDSLLWAGGQASKKVPPEYQPQQLHSSSRRLDMNRNPGGEAAKCLSLPPPSPPAPTWCQDSEVSATAWVQCLKTAPPTWESPFPITLPHLGPEKVRQTSL